MPLLKIILIILIFVGTSTGLFVYWGRAYKDRNYTLVNEFNKLVERSDRAELDLRSISSVEWDEIAYWPPYGNICDIGITGYSPDGSNCIQSVDDGEAYLLFLKNNTLIDKIEVDRMKTNFKDQLGRVKREKAVFLFENKSNFSLLYLKPEQ